MKYRISAYTEVELPEEPTGEQAFSLILQALHRTSKNLATVMVEGPIVNQSAPDRTLYIGGEPVSTEKAIRAW